MLPIIVLGGFGDGRGWRLSTNVREQIPPSWRLIASPAERTNNWRPVDWAHVAREAGESILDQPHAIVAHSDGCWPALHYASRVANCAAMVWCSGVLARVPHQPTRLWRTLRVLCCRVTGELWPMWRGTERMRARLADQTDCQLEPLYTAPRPVATCPHLLAFEPFLGEIKSFLTRVKREQCQPMGA